MQKQSKNWPGVQYPLNNFTYSIRIGCKNPLNLYYILLIGGYNRKFGFNMGCKFGLSVVCYRVVVEISSHTSVPIFEYPREREQFAPYIEYAVLHSQHRVGLERGSDNMMECALLQYIETRYYRNYRPTFEIAYEISYYANDNDILRSYEG